MDWRPDEAILAELAAHAGAGQTLRLDRWKQTKLPGGYGGAAVWRIDLRLLGDGGGGRAASYVVKVCRAREVEVMRRVSAVGAASFPELTASRLAAAMPDDPRASLFVSPFYPGRDLKFGDEAPPAVVEDLARLHADAQQSPRPAWSWRIGRDAVARFHADACAALETSHRYRATSPDHADWFTRLKAMAVSSPLVAEADDYPATLTHGDVHAGNIIASPDGRHTLIDWGNACWGPAMIDLANMVPLGSAAWEAYLNAYRVAGGTTPEPALHRSWTWARGVTALMYLPWIAEHRDDATLMIAQALEADAALAASGAARLP